VGQLKVPQGTPSFPEWRQKAVKALYALKSTVLPQELQQAVTQVAKFRPAVALRIWDTHGRPAALNPTICTCLIAMNRVEEAIQLLNDMSNPSPALAREILSVCSEDSLLDCVEKMRRRSFLDDSCYLLAMSRAPDLNCAKTILAWSVMDLVQCSLRAVIVFSESLFRLQDYESALKILDLEITDLTDENAVVIEIVRAKILMALKKYRELQQLNELFPRAVIQACESLAKDEEYHALIHNLIESEFLLSEEDKAHISDHILTP
jgi:hypothetical protein